MGSFLSKGVIGRKCRGSLSVTSPCRLHLSLYLHCGPVLILPCSEICGHQPSSIIFSNRDLLFSSFLPTLCKCSPHHPCSRSRGGDSGWAQSPFSSNSDRLGAWHMTQVCPIRANHRVLAGETFPVREIFWGAGMWSKSVQLEWAAESGPDLTLQGHSAILIPWRDRQSMNHLAPRDQIQETS